MQTENGWLRAYVGSGDRADIRSTGGGNCKPDDLQTCVRAGCTVSASLSLANGAQQYSATAGGAANLFTSPTASATTVSAYACQAQAASVSYTVSACPSPLVNFTESVAYSCAGTSPGAFTCSEGVLPTPRPTSNRNASSGTNASFVSTSILATSATVASSTTQRSRVFNTQSDASAYDSDRLTGADLVDVTATTATTTSISGNQAGRSDAGWKLVYSAFDEKTVTSPTLLGGCVIWSSLKPSGGVGGCASAGAVAAPFYQAEFLSGAPNCGESFLQTASPTVYNRSITRNVLSPPPEPTATVSVGAGGGSLRLATLEIQPGTNEVTQVSVGTLTEMLQLLYSVPLSREEHMCRHVDANLCR